MMRALVLTSNSLRHRYFSNIISEKFDLTGIISEKKSKYYSKPKSESALVRQHFHMLSMSEQSFFSHYDDFPDVPIMHLENSSINNEKTIDWAKEHDPEVVFLFGTGILCDAWLDKFHVIINLHLGLSPFYRGSATLFWPFVNNDISCVGATIHLAVKDVDAGPILARIKPDLEIGDDYYCINHKTIKKAIDSLSSVFFGYVNGSITAQQQTIEQNNPVYKKCDFNESVLQKALENIDQGLTASQIQEIRNSLKCNC